MTDSALKAIFLSYASQDADVARRICDAMRTADLEVWFDQSELRGGDAWDASIRKQIKDCALFVPIISANTNARNEGYFRLEWKLAVDRSHLMAENKPFFVPVILDDTAEQHANVPDAFRTRQWSRLSDDKSISTFAERIAKLVDPRASSSTNAPGAAPVLGLDDIPRGAHKPGATTRASIGTKIALACAAVALVGGGIYLAAQHKSTKTPGTGSPSETSQSATVSPLSIMVMPFANQTGDKEKAYIADVLSSSITSDLTRIRDAFIVPAATAFSLVDKKLSIPQLGKEAAVRFVLTGNVTGDKDKLRINAVLSDTQTGAQLWTETFDGKQTDLFALQDQVTTRVGNTIGPQMIIVAARESEKRASKPQVADLLMRANALSLSEQSLKNHQAMEALYRKALTLEPDNVSAKAGLAQSLFLQADNFASELKLDKAARFALAKQGADLAENIRKTEPNNPGATKVIGLYAGLVGDLSGAVVAAKRFVELEPKKYGGYNNLGVSLIAFGDIPGARAALERGLQFASPARPPAVIYGNLAKVAFIEDRPDEAIKWAQLSLQGNPNFLENHVRLALAYARKGDQVQARKAAAEVVRLIPDLKLDIKDDVPWPGKEAAYRKYIETQYLPAWRLAGLPE